MLGHMPIQLLWVVCKSAYTVLSGRILPEDGALPSIENQPPVKPTIN